VKERPDSTHVKPDGRGELPGYWVLKGKTGCLYDCASFDDLRYTALCVFDSREAAEANSASLDENQMFLNTLELYGPHLPACVRQGPLLPEPAGVSAEELWGILVTLGLAYVAANPPPAGQKVESFRLLPAELFRPTPTAGEGA